jgi:hypothetical protein
MTDPTTKGAFTQSWLGSGRDCGNGHGSRNVNTYCPAGAFITKIYSSLDDRFHNFMGECSDGTKLASMAGNPGAIPTWTCDDGWAPVNGWGTDVVFGLKMTCTTKGAINAPIFKGINLLGAKGANSNINFRGDERQSSYTCPDGYVASGYRGEYDSCVGSLMMQCAPGTDETKKACCMGLGSDPNSTCREYIPQSGTCDNFMRSNANKYPTDPAYSCLRSTNSLPLPQCTMAECSQEGYKPSGMSIKDCPSNLTLYDCKQIFGTSGASNAVSQTSLAQSCGPMLSKPAVTTGKTTTNNNNAVVLTPTTPSNNNGSKNTTPDNSSTDSNSSNTDSSGDTTAGWTTTQKIGAGLGGGCVCLLAIGLFFYLTKKGSSSTDDSMSDMSYNSPMMSM